MYIYEAGCICLLRPLYQHMYYYFFGHMHVYCMAMYHMYITARGRALPGRWSYTLQHRAWLLDHSALHNALHDALYQPFTWTCLSCLPCLHLDMFMCLSCTLVCSLPWRACFYMLAFTNLLLARSGNFFADFFAQL